MTSRQFYLLLRLTDKLSENLDEHTEIFIEERPWLWQKAGIDNKRKNLGESKKENKVNIEALLYQIQNVLNS